MNIIWIVRLLWDAECLAWYLLKNVNNNQFLESDEHDYNF